MKKELDTSLENTELNKNSINERKVGNEKGIIIHFITRFFDTFNKFLRIKLISAIGIAVILQTIIYPFVVTAQQNTLLPHETSPPITKDSQISKKDSSFNINAKSISKALDEIFTHVNETMNMIYLVIKDIKEGIDNFKVIKERKVVHHFPINQ